VHIDQFLEPTVLIVSGKGGTGKTTVAAALALVAARHGREVCIAEVDRKGSLAGLLGASELQYRPSEMLPGVWGMNIEPEESLAEYLDVQYHMRRISRVFTSSHFVDYITTAAPGLKDILVLGKIWYLEQGRQQGGVDRKFDTIVVDAPAAGHMLTFLSAPMGLSDAIRMGPIKRQAEWLAQMLQDPRRTRVHLVSLPEEMPVTETLETSKALEGSIGIDSGAVFANGVYSALLSHPEMKIFETVMSDGDPSEFVQEAEKVGLRLDQEDLNSLVGYGHFLDSRREIQAKHLKTLKKEITEPVIELPFLFSAALALPDVETLADVVEQEVERL
jgi:anion-transporting  ArsA/GET3 family ATPase